MKTKNEVKKYTDAENSIIKMNVWVGDFVKLHQIGNYQIIELRREGKSENGFSAHVNFQRSSYIFNTLDDAIAYCIALKYDGYNTKANEYFMKAIRN